jgi:hypothetical protein
MKKTFYPLLLIILTLPALCQSEQDVLDSAFSNFAMCSVLYENQKDNFSKEIGCGLLINSNYFATCLHVANIKNVGIKSVVIYYNFKKIQNGFSYDSVYANLNFKAKKGQYNFATHHYDSLNHRTDFVVLRLQKRVKTKKLTIALQDSLTKVEDLYSLGVTSSDGITCIPKFSKSTAIGNDAEQLTQNSFDFLGGVGDINPGFSGSPVYNSKGEIMGITQCSFEKISDLVGLDDNPNKPFLIENYRQGKKYFLALRISYIMKHYLKGYLD